MTSDQHELLPGPLHNLTLHIQVSKRESFYLFSSHQIRLPTTVTAPIGGNANDLSQLSSFSRRSQTPSPQKVQRMKYAQLDYWKVRVCQIIDQSQPLEEEEDESSSSTEDEGESLPKGKQKASIAKVENGNTSDQISIAWYSLLIKSDDVQTILEQTKKKKRWEELEVQLRSAWEVGSIDILGNDEGQNENGTYQEICLQFELKASHTSKNSTTQFPSTSQKEDRIKHEFANQEEVETIQIELKRIKEGKDEIFQSSMVSIELMKAIGTLKTKAQSLERERNSSRKLIHDNRKHERYHEPSASLINPGRIKRKLQDDSGFEGEEG